MKTIPQKTERLHSLDSLRAIMMLLGIILHSSITYLGGEPSRGWPLRDPNTESEFLGWLLSIIHNFRMPIFMLVAGFFAALLFYDRSPKKMIINRIKRIVLPFVVFVILLWPLVTISFSYSNTVFSFDKLFDSVIGEKYINTTFSDFTQLINFLPEKTMHLWFLYYLIMFSIVSYVLGTLFRKLPVFTNKISNLFNFIITKPLLKLVVFSLLTFLILLIMGSSWVNTSTSFIPEIGTFSFYFSFYLFGWVLFKSKHLLSSFLKYDRLFLILGIIIFTIYYLVDLTDFTFQLIALIKSISVWFFIFGFTGLFMRYFSKHSVIMRYVSDSAYWVYLLHLPLTGLIPGLISDWNISGFLKFSVVVLLTTLICFITYNLFVRTTFIGRFLNGRKYSRKLSDIKKTEELNNLKPVLD